MIGARRSFSSGKQTTRKLLLMALGLALLLVVASLAIAAYWSATTPAPEAEAVEINLDPAEHLK
jgi:hypothetical protein